jgi:hypothetical protein
LLTNLGYRQPGRIELPSSLDLLRPKRPIAQLYSSTLQGGRDGVLVNPELGPQLLERGSGYVSLLQGIELSGFEETPTAGW